MKLRDLLCLVLILMTSSIVPAYGEERGPRIGVITILSGPNATIGTAIRNGMELARHDRPDLLKKIVFDYEDDQSDPKLDIAAYQRLSRDKGIDVLFGLGPTMVNVLWPYVRRDSIPFINFNFEAAPAVGKPLVIRAMNHTAQYMGALATYLAQHEESREYPLIVGQHPFLQAMARDVGVVQDRGITVREVAAVLPSETDFRGLIGRLRAYKYKPVGLFLFPDSLIAFLKQARGLGFSATYFGTDLCESAAKLAGDPSLVEGCVYPDNEVSESFRRAYQSRYGNEAQLAFAGSAYDMAILLGDIFQQHPNVRGEALVKALSAVSQRRGVLGEFSFRNAAGTGQFFEYPIHVKRIKDGRGVVVE
jgi:ABC-type branched-subunit amino acid transport system substrate-binding protein